mgnify:CR=1 FL=1
MVNSKHVLVHAQPLQRGDDGIVATLPDPASAALVAAAEMHRGLDPVHAVGDLVEEIHAQRRLRVGIRVLGTHPRVGEETEVRIVELGHRYPRRPDRESSARSTGTSARMKASRVG